MHETYQYKGHVLSETLTTVRRSAMSEEEARAEIAAAAKRFVGRRHMLLVRQLPPSQPPAGFVTFTTEGAVRAIGPEELAQVPQPRLYWAVWRASPFNVQGIVVASEPRAAECFEAFVVLAFQLSGQRVVALPALTFAVAGRLYRSHARVNGSNPHAAVFLV